VQALQGLGQGTHKAGRSSVLRVLISYPAVPNADTLARLVKEDASCHPAATVDLTSLVTAQSQHEILLSLAPALNAVANQTIQGTHGMKRKREGV
jgi:hypothetical protein